MLHAGRGKRYTALLLLMIVLSPFYRPTTAGGSSQEPPRPDPKIVSAKTAFLTCEILYPKSEKGSFSTELDAIFKIANSTRIWSTYRPADATQAEIIIKIVEDRSLGTEWRLTLYVYDPEDNAELYKDERKFVTLSNDVTRLINHLVGSVLEERVRIREEAEAAKEFARQQADRIHAEEEENKLKGPAQITCENVNLYANRAAVRRVLRVLKKGDIVKITVLADEEVIVKVGNEGGYIDAQCVQLLPLPSSKPGRVGHPPAPKAN
jgi:hypothetical protein